MKKRATLALLSLLAGPVMADVTPPQASIDTRCTLSVSQPVIDYGIQSRWQLHDAPQAGSVTPGVRSLTMTVACPYAQTMLLLLDGRGAAQGRVRYGEAGYTLVSLMQAQLDGQAVDLQQLTDGGAPTGPASNTVILAVGQRVAPMTQGRRAEGKTLTLRLEVQPVIPGEAARVGSRQKNESRLTLTLLR